MVKYLSGRQKLRPSDRLTEDRYQYLGLDQAEPNLADPATSPGVPSGLQYQLVAVTGYEGRRYWVPVGGSLQPGAITIFDEGTPVSSASSITQMNFVGAAVTAQVSVQNPSGHPGIAATVTVIPVTVGDSPPIGVGATNNGELWWESDTGDLYVYYDDGNSSQWVMANAGGRGLTGDKGEVGDKGQKGDTGLTGGAGVKGDKGDKGAPSTVAGPAGDKGQKGEIGVGDKGQKGEDGVKGEAGDKGQKGEIGVGTKGDKGEGNTGGAQVTISDTAPTSPTPSNGDLWWESDTFDLHVYYEDGSSNQWVSITSNAALKGEKGDKGEVAQKGQKGEGANVATSPNPPSSPDAGDLWWDTDDGDLHVYYNDGNTSQWVNTSGVGAKGQKGEEGAAASKGQKGEVGDKGQKGEDNSTKGQKGEVGADNSTKGQKGEPSQIPGTKGQKGEVGADNSTKGQKGEAGADNSTKGQKGEQGTQGTQGTAGDKGQKGDEGFLANSSQTGSYTLVAADDQKLINTNSGVTVPSGVFSASDAVTIVNNGTSTITITQASGVTMYLAGTSTSGNRTLQQNGIATVVCVSSNKFIITGGGLY